MEGSQRPQFGPSRSKAAATGRARFRFEILNFPLGRKGKLCDTIFSSVFWDAPSGGLKISPSDGSGQVVQETGASNNLPRRLDVAAVRKSKGITLDQISDTTKLGKNFLRAIEDGEFKKLPGGIFSTSYIRQYARAIDINEEDLLAEYYERTGTAPGLRSKPPETEGTARHKGFRWPAAVRF